MDNNRLVIYIAGSYSGPSARQISENVAVAEAVGQEIMRRGHVALCPHSMTHDWDICTGLGYQDFIECDLILLSRCDAICMCGNWPASAGACQERTLAVSLDLRIFDSVLDIPDIRTTASDPSPLPV